LVHKRQGIFLTSSQNYLSYQPWWSVTKDMVMEKYSSFLLLF
jgi:hypothetical protein